MDFYKILKKRILILIQNTRGQSMVEFAVALPTVVLLLWAGMYIGNIYLVKHKTLAAARYGTWNFARGEQTTAQVKTKIPSKFQVRLVGFWFREPFFLAGEVFGEDPSLRAL